MKHQHLDWLTFHAQTFSSQGAESAGASVILRLLVACAAAEERITDLAPDCKHEPVLDLICAAMAESERYLCDFRSSNERHDSWEKSHESNR